MLQCKPPSGVLGLCPTLCVLPKSTVQHGIGATCFWSVTHAARRTMWNRSPVSSCQPARRPEVLSEHALHAVSMLSRQVKLANSCIFHQKWFSGDVWWGFFSPFFSVFQRWGGWIGGVREAGAGGGQERLGCSWTWAVAFGGADCMQVYISGAVGVKHPKDLLPAEVSWRGSAWPVGPKSIRVFSQLMNYEMRNGSLSPGFRISPKRAPTYCNDLKRKQILLASHAKSVRCVHARTQESGA